MAKIPNNLNPLSRFYELTGLTLPQIDDLKGDELPEPYGHLLVHNSDMTPRLANYHNSEIILEIIQSRNTSEPYMRLVNLRKKETKEIVEFGAIFIHLSEFDESAKNMILGGNIPLGEILQRHSINHSSKPNMYFSIASDRLISESLGCEVNKTLYGRCNTITNDSGSSLADIVEILPVMS